MTAPLPRVLRRAQELIPGFVVFTKPYDLNWVVERSPNRRAGELDDLCTWSWTDESGAWHEYAYRCSVDPGRAGLRKGGPAGSTGTLILESNRQNRASHRPGLHKGRRALVQVGKLAARRDGDRDDLLEPAGPELSGLFGANHHDDAGVGAEASEGCVVAAKVHVVHALELVEVQEAHGHGDEVSLTIIEMAA